MKGDACDLGPPNQMLVGARRLHWASLKDIVNWISAPKFFFINRTLLYARMPALAKL